VLLLFDFQQQMERRLAELRDGSLRTQLVQVRSGLCVPDTYVAVCEQVCQVLSSEYPERKAGFEERLALVKERLQRLAAEVRTSVADAGIAAAKVLASDHQAEFVQWLGLEPVATFVGSDLETIANIDYGLRKAAGQDIRFVIANRQEGSALAETLADRLQAKAVVFSNFPEAAGEATGFDRLLRDNVGLLREAVGR
jgi:ABC-type Zn uptake system ZnuABC Zn-binding protein ZnuA